MNVEEEKINNIEEQAEELDPSLTDPSSDPDYKQPQKRGPKPKGYKEVKYYGIFKFDPSTKDMTLIQFTTNVFLAHALAKDWGLTYRQYVTKVPTDGSDVVAVANDRLKAKEK